jgi:hypothetical protein
MTNKEKLNEAWALLYKVRKDRNAPLNRFNNDPISNTLLHAMKAIEEANEEIGEQ